MSGQTVFPRLTLDIERATLIRFVDAESVVNLSRVSKRAQDVLSNDFFKSFLISHYPHLEPLVNEKDGHPKTFRQLPMYLPNHCWKMTCVFMSCFSKAPSPKKISFSFFRDVAGPSIHEAAVKRKNNYETQIKEICGSDYQDSESPIHKAWLCIDKTCFGDHIRRRKTRLDSLEIKLVPEDFLALRKSILAVSFACSDTETKWSRDQLSDRLKNVTAKFGMVLDFADLDSIETLHENASKLPLNHGWEKYIDYMNLEITRAENQLEVERLNSRLPKLSLPAPLTQAEVDVLTAYNLSESFVPKDKQEEWLTKMTKNLPNPNLIKNFIQEFAFTRDIISKIFVSAEKYNKDQTADLNDAELYG